MSSSKQTGLIQLKRVYDSPAKGDGRRFLIERLWPRGLKKESLQLDAWLREAGPSTELRKWFHHDPTRWTEFKKRYNDELKKKKAVLEPVLEAAREGPVTLLYSSHDQEHNNAVALQSFLEKQLK